MIGLGYPLGRLTEVSFLNKWANENGGKSVVTFDYNFDPVMSNVVFGEYDPTTLGQELIIETRNAIPFSWSLLTKSVKF